MKSDKITTLRIFIFLGLAFVPPWVLSFVYMAVYGKTVDGAFYALLCSVAMLAPAIANILTRVITGEGFEGIGIKFDIKGNVRYIILALCFPVICGYLTVLVASATFLPDCRVIDIITKTNHIKTVATALYCAGVSVFGIILGFGEEFGWRAYLTPKLEEKMPLWAAVIISGIIWGLWHAPLIVCGHNFGTDYRGYPFVGILLMCAFCIFMGLFLTSLVKATGSVLPAALTHIAFNNTTGIISGTIFTFVVAEDYIPGSTLYYPLAMMASTAIIALIAGLFIIIALNNKTE